MADRSAVTVAMKDNSSRPAEVARTKVRPIGLSSYERGDRRGTQGQR